jgi:excisionase family DNA binding protein
MAPVVTELRELRATVERLAQSTPAQFLSVAEAAKRTGLCEWTIRRMAKAQELVSRRAGRRLLIDSSSLKATDPATVNRLAREARS